MQTIAAELKRWKIGEGSLVGVMALNEVPLVLLPEVAGEGNQQHRCKGSQSCAQLHPELHALTQQCFLLGQRGSSNTQFWLGPNVQQVLGERHAHLEALHEHRLGRDHILA